MGKALLGYAGLFMAVVSFSMLPSRYQVLVLFGGVMSSVPIGCAAVAWSDQRAQRSRERNAEWAERAKQEWINGQA